MKLFPWEEYYIKCTNYNNSIQTNSRIEYSHLSLPGCIYLLPTTSPCLKSVSDSLEQPCIQNDWSTALVDICSLMHHSTCSSGHPFPRAAWDTGPRDYRLYYRPTDVQLYWFFDLSYSMSSTGQHVEKMTERAPLLVGHEALEAVHRWFIIHAGRSVIDWVRIRPAANTYYIHFVYERRTYFKRFLGFYPTHQLVRECTEFNTLDLLAYCRECRQPEQSWYVEQQRPVALSVYVHSGANTVPYMCACVGESNISFSLTSEAHIYSRQWNTIECHARGAYIEVLNCISRSCNILFSILRMAFQI